MSVAAMTVADVVSEFFFSVFFPQTGEWTDHEQSLLTRAMIKFPGGTPNRWEKIAVEIGRSVEEVRHLAACSCFDLSCAVSALNAVKSDSDIKPNPSYPKLSYFDGLKNIRSTVIRLFLSFVFVFCCCLVCVSSLYHCRLSALFVHS